jgi:hypothetical protein
VSDIFSVLQNAYASASLNTAATSGKYVAVQPSDYQGTWTGEYPSGTGQGTPFTFTISDVNGFKAEIKYQSGSTLQRASVLIKNSTFRIGDTQFQLTGSGSGTAIIKSVVTSPVDGSLSMQEAEATQKSS